MSFHQRQCHGCGQPCDGYYCESYTCPQCGMTLFNGICDNCIYGAGMPIICSACRGIDALDSTARGNFLDKIPRECLSIIESKSKIAASLEDKLDIRMNRFEKSLNDMKNSFITPTAHLKAVEE
nr:hypothetical protein [Tanacetum cinerariifolium]